MKQALLLLLGTFVASTAAHARIITIRLPEALEAPGDAEVALSGKGLCLQTVSATGNTIAIDVEKLSGDCSSGSHDFRPITNVKVLLLVPGYQVARLDTDTYTSPIWVPELIKLRTVMVEGLVDPPPQVPLRLSLEYSLLEAMPFFGYYDGAVPVIELGTATTDAKGHFSLAIADLTGDPFIQAESASVHVRFNKQDHPEPGEALEDLWVKLRELYAGSRLVLRHK
jgi:hypothetical protein